MTVHREISLASIARCFSGSVPAVLATADADGVPNVTYLSRAHPVDDHRIALSNQFMSKTSRNLAVNPRASLLLIDPVTYDEYRLALVYERTERRGPVFEQLRAEIDDLAALVGMQHVFRLRAADVFRVVEITEVTPDGRPSVADRSPDVHQGALGHALDVVRAVSRAPDADAAIDLALAELDRLLGYRHTALMLLDESGGRLYTIAGHGYPPGSLGAEIAVGDGHVGAAAARCEPVVVDGLRQLAKYSRSIRRQYEVSGLGPGTEPSPPALPDVDSRIVLPAMCRGQLIGVLVAESVHPHAFGADDERVLGIVAAALAAAIELERDDAPATVVPSPPTPASTSALSSSSPTLPTTSSSTATTVRFFEVDGSVFVDGDYLIKGVAGRILWSLLGQFASTGRRDFTNRELRLDPVLDLPGFKDNLESRLLLLRRRLDERDAPFRLVRTGRGRFRMDVDGDVALECGDGPNGPQASAAAATPV